MDILRDGFEWVVAPLFTVVAVVGVSSGSSEWLLLLLMLEFKGFGNMFPLDDNFASLDSLVVESRLCKEVKLWFVVNGGVSIGVLIDLSDEKECEPLIFRKSIGGGFLRGGFFDVADKWLPASVYILLLLLLLWWWW